MGWRLLAHASDTVAFNVGRWSEEKQQDGGGEVFAGSVGGHMAAVDGQAAGRCYDFTSGLIGRRIIPKHFPCSFLAAASVFPLFRPFEQNAILGFPSSHEQLSLGRHILSIIEKEIRNRQRSFVRARNGAIQSKHSTIYIRTDLEPANDPCLGF